MFDNFFLQRCSRVDSCCLVVVLIFPSFFFDITVFPYKKILQKNDVMLAIKYCEIDINAYF
jgi:hypothetical protein